MLLSLSVNTMPLCSLDAGAIHFNLLHPAFGMDTTIQLFLLVRLSVCAFGCS